MLRPVGKLCSTLLLAASGVALAQQYSITTAAGGAPPSTPVAATSTSIGLPGRVTVDKSGNIYFSSSNSIFRIDGSGTLTLIAGNSRPGFSGDGGRATQAQLNAPQGIAFDSAGNLYIADSKNNRVRMVNPSGVISTFAGTGQISPGGPGTFNDGGLATNALLHLPSGVAVDSKNNVYIADTGDNLIREVTTDGLIHSFAGDSYGAYFGDTGPATVAEVHSPEDVAVDSSGNIYIADTANSAIRKVTTDGNINTVAGNCAATTGCSTGSTGDGGSATAATLMAPFSVAVDSSGNFYIVENGDSKIRKVDTSGNINTIVGTGTAGFGGDNGPAISGQLNFPTGIALDSGGALYIADSLNRRIRKVSSNNINTIAGNGVLSYSGDGGPAIAGQLNTPLGVAADSSGNLYIADTGNNVIRKVAANGTITTFAGNGTAGFGGDGGAAASAQLNGPQAVAVDSNGNVYVSDTQNARVRKISGGVINTVAGNGTPGFGGDGASATAAELNVPSGLALDASGNLYIADFSNNRVRRVSPGGTITTVAGNGSIGYSGDSGSAASAQLTTPSGVAVDSSGNLYIADTGNNAVRVVTGGIIHTVAGNGLAGFSGDGGPAISAQVGNPVGVAIDSAGSLYVSDGSSRVRKVYATGFIVTIGGSGARGYSGDGGTGPFATLSAPAAMALAPSGNVYVADSGNNAIRVLLLGGYQLKISAVANSASTLSGPISPGEVVVLFGTGLGPANLVQYQPGPNGQVPSNLAGTVVYFGTHTAPILYTWASQVAAVVPYEVTGSLVQVFVVYQGQLSAAFPVSLATAAPGIFTADFSGTGLASAVNIQNLMYVYNSAAHPANAGDYVELFLTGTGQTNPPGMTGFPNLGLSTCVLPVSVTLGGKTIVPEYDGGWPTVVSGVTQVNIQIPPGLPAGAAPVSVQVGGVSTQPGVVIYVSGK
ncbi:MAG TPA: hypothetical protein VLY04_12165 [Bryobacteraceae bacterium]|nr:hypothetical protein [Bryobacteraceae bacterium]